MKQQGQIWFDGQGLPTASKHVPNYERMAERVGHKIIARLTDIEQKIIASREEIKALCDEALQHHLVKFKLASVKRFTFFVFDKSYKIECEPERSYYRLYRATKANPTHKDYELVNTDFNKSVNQEFREATADLPPEPESKKVPITDGGGGGDNSLH